MIRRAQQKAREIQLEKEDKRKADRLDVRHHTDGSDAKQTRDKGRFNREK